MPKIQVLDKQIAELIAAGEVIERPSSVIKELVENSIDAGAGIITVEIRRGGVTYMRVTDDGCGMSASDVPTAFLRHATSKISAQDDLDSIMTLGFRGEALASISAVSHVELLTREAGADVGTHFLCGGSEEPTLKETGCPEGTTIVVRDLFYNTPARMKFLKKDSTEGNSVAGILDKMALSHPEISFRFIRDGKEQLRTPGDNKLSSAIYGVFGKEFLSTLIPLEYQFEHVNVTGFISSPAGSRPNRTMQNFFINGRYIRSRTAMAALEEAYKGSIMVGKFPACVLHISLSSAAVDVNVHPAKLEVRFVSERPIFDAVYHGVKSALAAGDKPKLMELKKPMLRPYAPVPEKQEQLRLSSVEKQPPPPPKPVERYTVLRDSAPKRDTLFSYADSILEKEPDADKKDASTPGNFEVEKAVSVASNALGQDAAPEGAQETDGSAGNLRSIVSSGFHSKIIGEAFGTYIIVEYSSDALMLIDKHAAHERLLYERLKSNRNGNNQQTLLEPVSVALDKDEYSAVLSHQKELLQAGFEVEDFGTGTVLVRAVPLILEGEDAAEAVMEIAGYLSSLKKDITTEHLDWVYHNVACRAAMKAGDRTSEEELISLAEELERNPQVRYCPHGRPIYIIIKRREIEKQFGRV